MTADDDVPRTNKSLQDEPIVGFPANAIGVQTVIEPEHGRWVVYLEVAFWDTGRATGRAVDADDPISTVRRRISDYPSKQQAEVAASWIERGADRDLFSPPTGF